MSNRTGNGFSPAPKAASVTFRATSGSTLYLIGVSGIGTRPQADHYSATQTETPIQESGNLSEDTNRVSILRRLVGYANCSIPSLLPVSEECAEASSADGKGDQPADTGQRQPAVDERGDEKRFEPAVLAADEAVGDGEEGN